jgi:hypothetical protein
VKLTPTLLLLSIVVSACAGPIWGQVPSTGSTPGEASSTQTSTALDPTASPALGPTASPGETFQASPTPRPTPGPEDWKAMPVAPTPSLRMVEVYRAGLAAGRDPARFSKIGDCQNITTYFLASFDKPDDYRLGPEYAGLQLTIDHFAGSWARESLAVRGGLNVAAAMNPLWADPKQCNPGETPLACEIRVYNPSIVTISMEESWSGDLEKYDRYLRQIVEYTLSQNVVPILATRAEPDGLAVSINATVARVAFDYDVPLWNFWAAAYALPNHGLTQDGFHLTQARSFFDDPNRMRNGWPWRNLTALQAIDSVYRGLSGLAASPTAAPEPAGQSPTAWQDWPVVPNVHPEMLAVYERGIGSGNNPGAFSKIGDGEISTVWFLDHYDRDPANYELGQHTDLQAVIDQFAGSYGRVSMAAGRGFTTATILGSGVQGCGEGESRLDCELRLHRPSFAIVSLGTGQVWEPATFAAGLRLIVERLLTAGVVPILSTKADDLEGDGSINRFIVGLADEFDLPLWNFWLAAQPLPAHGLQPDLEHLTFAVSDFDDPIKMQSAWPWRNLTALQALDAVWRAVTTGDEP